jgi:hypothetical protein
MDERYSYLPANCIKPPPPPCIIVQQVIGQEDVQKVIDIHLVVPKHKPAIEQVIDVLVKKLCITDVEVIPHKVIVRGHFELKALYVACLPSQPVHAVEARQVRFTAAAHIPGCTYGADADAHAVVEYVDYSACRHPFRKRRVSGRMPKWNKHQEPHHHDDDCDSKPDWHDDDCHDDYKSDCHECKSPFKHKPKPKHCTCHCYREIDATVIIRIRVKVTTDRELVLHANVGQLPGGQLPYKPKG